MTYSDIRRELEEYFAANWVGTIVIAYSNFPIDIPDDFWTRFVVSYGVAMNSALGNNTPLSIKKNGEIIIQLFGPKNKGTGELLTLADTALTLMQNKRFSDIFLYAGEVEIIGEGRSTSVDGSRASGDITGFYQINVNIPFEAF